MEDVSLTSLLLRRLAVGSIPASTVRNMGPAGTMSLIQNHLSNESVVKSFSQALDQFSFDEILACQTAHLQEALCKLDTETEEDECGDHWGVARKCLNIFIYECSLNRYICETYNLYRLEDWLEVPLDGLVGYELHKDAKAMGLLTEAWWSVKRLTPKASQQYQVAASHIAATHGLKRVQVELLYWNPTTAIQPD